MPRAQHEKNREVVEGKLCLLVGAGADLNHVDGFGYTPSLDATYSRCWDKRCRALKTNGLNVDEAVKIDQERSALTYDEAYHEETEDVIEEEDGQPGLGGPGGPDEERGNGVERKDRRINKVKDDFQSGEAETPRCEDFVGTVFALRKLITMLIYKTWLQDGHISCTTRVCSC